MNRLKGSTRYQRSGNTWSLLAGNSAFDEKGLTYDKNGNILTLSRTGSTPGTQSYTYTGNQLKSVTKGGVTGTYMHDKNGNMIHDSRKALNLSYNVLNLLSAVNTGPTRKATYTYGADGTKLKVLDGSGNGICYLGSLTYMINGGSTSLEGAMFGGGRIVANSSTRAGNELRYFLTDHLGSTRVIVDQNGMVRERDDYYPFGGRYVVAGGNVDTGSRWKYNGKEEQMTGNLGWLDYGARMYDWELGRWFGMDPKASKFYSLGPYNYCSCNPLLFVDLNGEEGLPYFTKFAYTNNPVLNLLKLLPNTATNIVNGAISVINSGISTGETILSSGLSGYASGVASEIKGVGAAMWNGLSSTASYHTNTPFSQQLGDAGRSLISADSWETSLTIGSTLFMGATASNQTNWLSLGNKTSKINANTVGLSNGELVQKSATLAERALGGKGPVAGIAKHKYAEQLIKRYQKIYGNRGLRTNYYFNNGVGNKGFLDVVDLRNNIIYDYKFGISKMSSAQYNKYFNNFGIPVKIIRP